MSGGLIVYFWEQWDIQILVVLGFTLQVILLLSAGIRRREGSTLLRTLLWLAYLMADYTAIYALGHMSISSRSRGHQMVPFWAPFLLLHLGGPDTITAYAFEDNQLWLRHLLNLVGQVAGAAYVLYQYIAVGRNPSTLLAAAALMFILGFLKYGERIWALKRASIDSIASSLSNKPSKAGRDGRDSPYHGRKGGKRLDTEDILLGAHYVRNVFKAILVDSPVMEVFEYKAIAQGIQLNGDMYMYELVGMELSIMYDILYTKAAVINTWFGYSIRIISPLSTVAAFLLFQLSSKDTYSIVDIIVTYVLLVGALFLEIASSLRAAGSSWACASFHAQGWHRLCAAVMRLRRFLKAGARRTCLDSLGQYNHLDHCTRDVNDLRGKIARLIGLEDRWQKLHYSSTIPISDDIKALVLEEIRKRGIEDMRNARGRWILRKRGMYEDLMWIADNTNLEHIILVWHVATDLYLSMCPEKEADVTVRGAIRVLSNHMLFLLVVHPYLLPGVVRPSRYKQNYYYFTALWRRLSSKKGDGANPSGTAIVKKIAEWQLQGDPSSGAEDDDEYIETHAYDDGSRLARMLIHNRWCLPVTDMLQVIAGVWVEMLCYAGHHSSEEAHAKRLSTGGEFMTAVWLLMWHPSLYDGFAPSAEALAPVNKRSPVHPNKPIPVPERYRRPSSV